MRNPLVQEAVAFSRAIGALKVKPHEVRYVGSDVEIHQRNRPVLILTAENARGFCNQIDEASHD